MHGPQAPLLVNIPVDTQDGVTPTIDDLDVEYYIRPSLADRCVIDLDAVRRYFVHYPGTHELIPFSCTIRFEDQSNRQGVNRTLQQMGVSDNWKGNLVVLKNATTESYGDMNPQDMDIAVTLVKR